MTIATQEITYTHALLACQLDRKQIHITILHSDTEISLAIGIIVEEGKWDGNLPGEDGFNLGYYRFNLAWLMEGDQDVF